MKDLSMLPGGLLGKVTFCGPRAWRELIWIYSSKESPAKTSGQRLSEFNIIEQIHLAGNRHVSKERKAFTAILD
jgi:hypothetical protein